MFCHFYSNMHDYIQVGDMNALLPVLRVAKEKGLRLALHLSEVSVVVQSCGTLLCSLEHYIQCNDNHRLNLGMKKRCY